MKLILLLMLATAITAREGELPQAHRLVCYYTNWSGYRPAEVKFRPENVDPKLCTHILYAFIGIDSKTSSPKSVDPYQDIDLNGFKKITDLKHQNSNLKVLVSIGGWNEGSSNFSPVAADKGKRALFINNTVKFLKEYNFDGVDLVWQYPTFRNGGHPDDCENYASLIEELREKFNEVAERGEPQYLLSVVMASLADYINQSFDIPKINRYADFINVVSYDYYLSSGPFIHHHAPLYPLKEELDDPINSILNVDATVKTLVAKGITRSKVNLGIPAYGRLYKLENNDETVPGSPAWGSGVGNTTGEAGYIPYYELCSDIKNGDWTVKYPNTTAMGPYAYKNNLWVGYDDEGSVKRKAQYAIMNGLGGVMFWTMDHDDFLGRCQDTKFPLIKAAQSSLAIP